MILTVTLNASIDTNYVFDNFSIGNVNRVEKIQKTLGGKGLNVSRVLHKLGSEILATGFLGGKNGEFISDGLLFQKIPSNFFKIQNETRTCVVIRSQDEITEILEKGPLVMQNEWVDFKKKFKELLFGKRYIVLSGSLPQGISQEGYLQLMELCSDFGVKVFLDTSGKILEKSLLGKPFFIKPNQDEIEELFGEKIISEADIIRYGKLLLEKEIKNVLITLGKNGAIFFNENGIYRCSIPQVKVKNSVGSGDSTLAGFVHGLNQNLPIEETLKLSLACGISNAMLDITGDIELGRLDDLKSKIKIEKIEQ